MINIKAGNYIGGIYKRNNSDGLEYWKLVDSKVTKIVQNLKGTKIYSKNFYPLDLEDVELNTELMEKADGYILTREVFYLTDEIRNKCEKWIEWANNTPEKDVSIFESKETED